MPVSGQKTTVQPQAVSNEALTELENVIQRKYLSYIKSYRQVIWPTIVTKCPDRRAFVDNGISQVNFDLVNFNYAIKEI